MLNTKMQVVNIGVDDIQDVLYYEYRMGKFQKDALIENGFYLADIRADNGDLYTAVLEPSVHIDYAGCLISVRPFDFGPDGFIPTHGQMGFMSDEFGEKTPLEFRTSFCVEKCEACRQCEKVNDKQFCAYHNDYCKSVQPCVINSLIDYTGLRKALIEYSLKKKADEGHWSIREKDSFMLVFYTDKQSFKYIKLNCEQPVVQWRSNQIPLFHQYADEKALTNIIQSVFPDFGYTKEA